MRVLVTGCHGYIGSVLAPLFVREGIDVVGLDTNWFEDCVYGQAPAFENIRRDIRDITPADLAGFDAVVHLAALSNDPMANLDPELTYDINHLLTVRIAKAAKRAAWGVSSSRRRAAPTAPAATTF